MDKIQHDNEILVKKITEITFKRTAIDNNNEDFLKYRRSLNVEQRQKELDRIQAENMVRRCWNRFLIISRLL
jgi:hypothetical protein